MNLQDFYNLANELGNLAQITGQPLMFFGQKILADADAASKLILMGLSHLRNIDGEGVMVDLGAFAMNMTASALAGTANFEDAIHAMADSQIQMLDGMIAVLLTVVAMEKLSNIDADKDIVILLPEIFFSRDGKNVNPNLTQFNESYITFATNLIKLAETNEDLNKALRNVFITTKNETLSLYDLIADAGDGYADLVRQGKITNLEYQAFVNSLYQMAKSGDWDLNNLAQSFNQIAANSDLNLTVKLNDTQTLRIAYGVQAVITRNDENKYVYNGKSYDNPDQAFMAARLLAAGALLNYDFTENGGKGTFEIKSTINELASLTVEVSINGDKILYSIKGKMGSYVGFSKKEALQNYFQHEVVGAKNENGDIYQSTDYEKWLFTLYGEVSADLYVKEVTIDKPEKFKLATQDQINKLVNDLLSGSDVKIIEEDLKTIGLNYSLTVGADGKIVSSDVDALLTFLGKKLQTIAMVMTGSFSGENQEALQKIFKGEEIPVKLRFDSESSSDDVQAVLKALETAGTNTENLRSELNNLNNKGNGYTVEIKVDPDSKASTAITEVKTKAEGLDKTFTSVYTFSNLDGSMRLLYTADQRINRINGEKQTTYTFFDKNGNAESQTTTLEKNINGLNVTTKTDYIFDENDNAKKVSELETTVLETGEKIKEIRTTWTYDPAGNYATSTEIISTYNATGDIVKTVKTTWTYDPDGTTTTMESIEQDYNAARELVKEVKTSWVYDPLAKGLILVGLTLIAVSSLSSIGDKQITTEWTYNPNEGTVTISLTIAEVDELGKIKTLSTTYFFDGKTWSVRQTVGNINAELNGINDPSNEYDLSYDPTDLQEKVSRINKILEGISAPFITFGDGNITIPTISSDTFNSSNKNNSSYKEDGLLLVLQGTHGTLVGQPYESDDIGLFTSVQGVLSSQSNKTLTDYEVKQGLLSNKSTFTSDKLTPNEARTVYSKGEILPNFDDLKLIDFNGRILTFDENTLGSSHFSNSTTGRGFEGEKLLPWNITRNPDGSYTGSFDNADKAVEALYGLKTQILGAGDIARYSSVYQFISEALNNLTSGMDSLLLTSENTSDISGKLDAIILKDNLEKKTESVQDSTGSNSMNIESPVSDFASALKNLGGILVATGTSKTDFNFLSAITGAQQATEATNEASLSAAAMAQAIASSVAESSSTIGLLASVINSIPSNGSGKIYNLISAINSIPSRKLIQIIATVLVKVPAAGNGATATVKGQIPGKNQLIKIAAKGNVALAGGNQKTLMGLLGPELVVANGQYNVVGQNGAEMVNLPRDAIVFNHLQTRKLLNGGTGGHGKPVTNLRVAVSLATGTVGPAFASASAALAALKQIRAMWQAMRDASAKDLGSMAGKLAAGDSGGNGGGGGGKDELIKASTAEIERWYNLTRQIDKLLQDITHQQTLRDKLDSDRIANGKAIYESRKLLLNNLMKQITATKELVFLQKSWYDRKRALLEASSYGKIFTYDENGLQQYTSGSGRGLDILEKLTLRDVNGKLLNNAESARKQIDYLKSIGFNIEDLKYNDDGTVIDFKNKGDKSDDDLYLEMMLNFWSAVDGWKDLLDSLYDSYRESNESILLLENNINGLLKEVVDNQRLVEDAVVKAIEDREQAIIDKLQDLRDAILEAAQKYIDGLQDSLDRLKQMYLSNQEEEDLNKLRRQILILQRTGGSGAQIGSLQNELNTKERDAYFNEQQATIDAIQQASDKELLRLDAQLDLMNDTLEYQKEHGLLWQEVTSIMSQNEEDILNFLLVNTSEYQSYSSLQMEELKLELQKQLGQWVGYRDDFSSYWQGVNLQFTTVKGSIEGMDQRLWKTTDAAMIQIFGKDAWQTYADDAKEVFDQILGRTGDETKAQLLATLGADGLLRTPDGTVVGTTGTTPTSGTGKEERGSSGGKSNSNNTSNEDLASLFSSFSSGFSTGFTSIQLLAKKYKNTTYESINDQYHNRIVHYTDGTEKKFKLSHSFLYLTKVKRCTACGHNIKLSEPSAGFSTGGMVDFTGPAMLHGSKDKPLAVLNPLQTRFLREDFLSGANTLHNTLLALEAVIEGSANSTTYNSIDHGETVTILNASVNVHVDSIANDYDASRIGDMAVERMIGIARKSGSRSVSRR